MAEHSRFIANAEITPQEAMCALGERLGQLQFKWDPESALLSQYPLLPPPPPNFVLSTPGLNWNIKRDKGGKGRQCLKLPLFHGAH